MGNINLRRLGKVLLVGADSAKIQFYMLKLLENEGTVVDVVEYEVSALIRLSSSNHGYNFVFLGDQPNYPDVARRILMERVDVSAE